MTALEPTSDLEYAELVANIEQTAARTLDALGHINAAWTNINNQLPGYRSTTAGDTPPEDFTKILDDPAIHALDDLRRRTRAVLEQATTLRALTVEWATGDTPPAGPMRVELELWCTSCLTADHCSPIYRGAFCRWCYDFNLVEHQRPPAHLLKQRHQGIKITEAMVAEALGRKRNKRRR